MPVTINGNGSVTGISAGGLPDNIIDGGNIALGSDAQGDTMYYNGTDYIRLAKGSASHVLTMNSGATAPEWAAAAAGGKILQYVYESDTTSVTTSGGTESELIDAQITPAHEDNKILIIGEIAGLSWASSNAWMQGYIRRGSISGTIVGKFSDGHASSHIQGWSRSPVVYDHPNTTSAQEYTMSFLRGSSNTSNVQTDGNKYSLLLVELAA